MKIQDAINLSVENIKKEGTTDVEVFLRPFELEMIKGNTENEVKAKIKESFKQNSLKSLKVSPISHVLVPKKELFDFRKCAHIQPLDEMKYLALVLQVADKAEKARINKSRNKVFSYRFSPQKGYLFDPRYNYTSFREYVSKCSKKNNINVVVSSDISNFYDRLNLHRLECILASIDGCDKKVIHQINELLLFWSNRDSYGLPVGSNASRILAEASLIEVDNYLLSQKVNFCRFVDDYRIFAKDAATAHHWLSLLVNRLSMEGLFINTSKTEIKDVSTYRDEELGLAEVVPDEAPKLDEVTLNTKFNIPKIIRGYSGLIPTKFRKLSDGEVLKLNEVNTSDLLDDIKLSIVIEPRKFIQLIKCGVSQPNPCILIDSVRLLNKFPQFIPYTLDAISKMEAEFSDEQIEEVSLLLNEWLNAAKAPEFILVFIVRFFGTGLFKNKELLFNYFRKLRRNEGSYIGRAVLEQLEDIVSRGEVLEIRDYYSRADMWEKRQIAKMVDLHLTEGEKRPFFKNILSIEDDVFLSNTQNYFVK
ncbi:MAG: RNA-directed DNA polymerase [Oceanospirillales bacterium]|nr:RNA-directed DNA polymerase [Oceanospirillales bacterium]